MSEIVESDVIIIGGGPAGLTAAIYCGRANMDVLVMEGKTPSALAWTKEIGNYPGVGTIPGPALQEAMRVQAEEAGARFLKEDVIAAMLDMNPKMVTTRASTVYSATAVILATGKQKKSEQIPEETTFLGHGLSYCALCDGPLYREKSVVIYGDDDETVEDCLALVQMGCEVAWVTPGTVQDVSPELGAQAREAGIAIHEATKITRVVGDDDGRVAGVVLATKDEQGEEHARELATNALFIISHVVSNALFDQAGIHLTEDGFVAVNAAQETNYPGVFAAGDVTGGILQVVMATAEGARAGIEANKFVRLSKK